MGLSERQQEALASIKAGESLSNAAYQTRFGVSKPTATRDLEALVRKGVLERVGTTGKGTRYVLRRKGLTKGSKGSSRQTPRKGS